MPRVSIAAGPTLALPPTAAAALRAVRLRLTQARGWLGRSLARRFVASSLGLLLAVQLASFLLIDGSLRRHAMAALPEQLAMGVRATQRSLDWRSERLIESARLLAADYGFRSAVLTQDRATIASALSNHSARIGATEVALLDTLLQPVALAEGHAWDPGDGAAAVAALAEAAAAAGGASQRVVLKGQPRQMVLVPMKAPVLVGWVLMYFPLPAALVDDVHELAAADLSVFTRAKPQAPWQLAFSRLAPEEAQALAAQPWAGTAPGGMAEAQVGERQFAVRTLWLSPPEAAAAGEPAVLALLTVPVDPALRAPRKLQIALLFTTLLGFLAFGLGSAYTARRITTPLQSLAAAAERLGAGDASTPLASAGSHDEVHELARSFEQMRLNLASKQEQILQSEKLASIGQLAAGVAHEINNPIGFVFSNFGTLEGYLTSLFKMLGAYREETAALAGTPAAQRLQALREEIELDYLEEDIPALMSESRDGIKRVRKIVQDLKDFSHVDAHQEWETVDLHAGLDSTLNIVGNELKYKAEVVREYGTLPAVECLPHELNQVFMNLLVNAAHAIGPARGLITLRTGTAGAEAWVEVADNGCGIAPADLKRIFDPFFTTKPVGKGTGLGLSLSYGIVKKHAGRIEVSSEAGRGTRFRVCIPLRRTPPAPA